MTYDKLYSGYEKNVEGFNRKKIDQNYVSIYNRVSYVHHGGYGLRDDCLHTILNYVLH